MPAILERLVSQLQAKGKSKSSAFAIATSALQNRGILKRGSQELTSKGSTRNSMTASSRAKSRAAKYSNKHSKGNVKNKPKDYSYSSKTNRATKGKK